MTEFVILIFLVDESVENRSASLRQEMVDGIVLIVIMETVINLLQNQLEELLVAKSGVCY